jgi:hypothetical protein
MRVLLALLLCLASASAFAQARPSVDASGSITVGGTFQSVTLPSGVIYSVDFINICSVSGNCASATDSCQLYFGSATPTVANSIPVPASFEYLRSSGAIPNDAISVTCTSTGDKYYLNFQ